MDINQIKLDLIKLYQELQPYCEAFYLGGSLSTGLINKPHDIDIIIYTKPGWDNICKVRKYLKDNNYSGWNNKSKYDFVAIIDVSKIELNIYSCFEYKKIIGTDINFKFDILKAHRQAFIEAVKEYASKIDNGYLWNRKRWYLILYAIYILQNNSWDFTEVQKAEINTLHDLAEGWEELRDKTKRLLKII